MKNHQKMKKKLTATCILSLFIEPTYGYLKASLGACRRVQSFSLSLSKALEIFPISCQKCKHHFRIWQENLKGVIKAALKKNILGRRKGAEDQSGHFLMLHCSKLDQKYVFYLSENKFHCLTFLVYALLYVEMYVFLEVF